MHNTITFHFIFKALFVVVWAVMTTLQRKGYFSKAIALSPLSPICNWFPSARNRKLPLETRAFCSATSSQHSHQPTPGYLKEIYWNFNRIAKQSHFIFLNPDEHGVPVFSFNASLIFFTSRPELHSVRHEEKRNVCVGSDEIEDNSSIQRGGGEACSRWSWRFFAFSKVGVICISNMPDVRCKFSGMLICCSSENRQPLVFSDKPF